MRRRGLGRQRPSLIGTAARTAVVAGTATAVAGRVAGAQEARAHRSVPTPPAPPPPAASGALTDDVVQQLRSLGELRDAGILTEEEFAAKKAQILGI